MIELIKGQWDVTKEIYSAGSIKFSVKIKHMKYQTLIPVWPALAAALIILKLVGLVKISWWWVFSPLWIPAIAGLAVVGVIGIILAFLKNK
jgi:hypothetical protein